MTPTRRVCHFANRDNRPACGGPTDYPANVVTNDPTNAITCEECRREAVRFVLVQVGRFVATKISRGKLNELCGLLEHDNTSLAVATELPDWFAQLRAINTGEAAPAPTKLTWASR